MSRLIAATRGLQRHPHDRPEDDHPFGDRPHQHIELPVVYKGVASARLALDLAEPALPVGIRPGSATAVAMAQSGRKPTELDPVTLWFGDYEVAVDYCKKASASVLLRIDSQGHQLLQGESSYYTFKPVPWSRVSYMTEAGAWAPIQRGRPPRDAKDFSADEEEEASFSDDD